MKSDSKFVEKIALLFVTFLFSTIVGGYLTHRYQQASWKYQNRATLLETERARATAFFDELSRLIDKRMYRMQLILNRLCENNRGEALNRCFDDYNQLLHEWNNNLNRNIAMTERYFGPQMRTDFEYNIHRPLRDLGSELSAAWKNSSYHINCKDLQDVKDIINISVCQFDNLMIQCIQTGNIGIFRVSDNDMFSMGPVTHSSAVRLPDSHNTNSVFPTASGGAPHTLFTPSHFKQTPACQPRPYIKRAQRVLLFFA